MKKLLFLLLLCSCTFAASAQKVTKSIIGEYSPMIVTDQSRLYAVDLINGSYQLIDAGLSGVIDGHGGQYSNIIQLMNGDSYIVGWRQVAGDDRFKVSKVPFTGSQQVYALYQMYLLVRNNEIYVYGLDYLNINGGAKIITPIKLNSVTGKTIKNIAVSASTDPVNSTVVRVLMQDGSMYDYRRSTGLNPVAVSASEVPGKITFSDFMGSACHIIATDTNIYARVIFPTELSNYYGIKTKFVGLQDFQRTAKSIKDQFTKQGAVWPLKQISVSDDVLHIIDANDNLFGTGDNMAGEVGNGKKFNYLDSTALGGKYYKKWGYWPGNCEMYQPVVQIPGKWKRLFKGKTVTFYNHALDTAGNLHAWGRNKARALLDGYTTNDADQNNYPNALVMAQPSYIDPLNTKWTILPPLNINVGYGYFPRTVPPPPPVIVQPKVVATIFGDGKWKEGDQPQPANGVLRTHQLLDNGTWKPLNF